MSNPPPTDVVIFHEEEADFALHLNNARDLSGATENALALQKAALPIFDGKTTEETYAIIVSALGFMFGLEPNMLNADLRSNAEKFYTLVPSHDINKDSDIIFDFIRAIVHPTELSQTNAKKFPRVIQPIQRSIIDSLKPSSFFRKGFENDWGLRGLRFTDPVIKNESDAFALLHAAVVDDKHQNLVKIKNRWVQLF